jgi:hypothetical protein
VIAGKHKSGEQFVNRGKAKEFIKNFNSQI